MAPLTNARWPRRRAKMCRTTIPYAPDECPPFSLNLIVSGFQDSEAHRRVWAEMLSGIFQVLNNLADDEFRTLLPIFFAGIRRLTAYATDSSLKEAVAELFQRVALVYGFGPT